GSPPTRHKMTATITLLDVHAAARPLASGAPTHPVPVRPGVPERRDLQVGLAEVFERYDAILTPASTGVAPLGKATGSPIFCTLWTYCGLPAVSLPLLQGASGMPLGVQLVGPWGEDARLLRTARALVGRVERENQA
ncbi:MAG: hypothetical protein GY778_23770, partial [bacterium]|nr:hypothetical protein [bacterium]